MDKQIQIIKRDSNLLPAAKRPIFLQIKMACNCFSHRLSRAVKEQSKKGRKFLITFEHHILCDSALKAWADQHLTVFYNIIHYVTWPKEKGDFLLWLTSSSNLTSKNSTCSFSTSLSPPSAQGQHRTSQLATSLKINALPSPSCPCIKLLCTFHTPLLSKSPAEERKYVPTSLWPLSVASPKALSYTSPNKLLFWDVGQAYHLPTSSHLLTFFRSNRLLLDLPRGKTDKNSMWPIHFLPLAVPVNCSSLTCQTLLSSSGITCSCSTQKSINSLKINSSLCLE